MLKLIILLKFTNTVPSLLWIHTLKHERKERRLLLSTSAFLLAMIPLYIMALIGFVSRRMRILNSQANQVITQLMLYITLPALILYSLDTTFSIDIFTDFVWLVTMSIFILSISVFVAAWLRRRAALPLKQKSVYESLIIFGNQGFIGFAIAYILMAEQGIIYLTLFNICYLILIWTYGIYIFTKNEQSVNWKGLFLNPGILSTLTGLVMLFLPYKWPSPISDTFKSIGEMTIPLSMILIGSLLAEIKWHDFRQYSKNLYIWIAAGCKLVILPVFLFIFLFLHVPYPLIIIAVLTSAMPSASTTSVYAQKFGGDASFASFGVLVTTLLCIITIPLLYSLLQWLHPFSQ
ncbi:auxin efflux carrier [Virgibacillus indicus]|uniref:Auxin efflux carrier n=1 Tax=Virgibacillus indicus TaxID=2024554 RepID=A0A265N5N7_9BACI|nr:auxin efflux carrier [Virgibacillus indicus]